MPTEKIKYSENLRQGTDKLNSAIEQANVAEVVSTEAKNIAEGAVSVAKEANSKVDITQQQLRNIILNSGTSPAETIAARTNTVTAETYQTLGERLDKQHQQVAEQLAHKATITDISDINSTLVLKADKSEINSLSTGKADKTYVDTNISSLDTKINAQASGSPKGTYATISALQSAFPTGNSNIYVVSEDGKWYYWNGTAWTAGGVYQGIGIADGTIKTKQVAFLRPTHNHFNPNTVTIGKYISDTGVISDSTTYSISDFIDVESASDYFVNGTCAIRGYDDNGNFISGSTNLSGKFNTLSYKKIRLVILNGQIHNFILNKGTTGLSYIENGFDSETDNTQFQLKRKVDIESKREESFKVKSNLPQEKIDLLALTERIESNNYATVIDDYRVRWRDRKKSYKIDVLSNSPITVRFALVTPLQLQGISEFITIVYIEDVSKITNIQLGFTGNTWVRDSIIAPLKNGWNIIRFQTSAGDLSNWTQASELRLSLYFNSKTTVYLSDIIAIRPEKARILLINDHGYSNFKKVAYPQFKARKIPVTWAINPGRLGTQISPVERILNQQEIDELAYDPYSEFSYHAWNPTENYSAIMTAEELLEEHHKCTAYLKKNGLVPKYFWRAAYTTNVAPEHKAIEPYLDGAGSYDGKMGLELYPFRDRFNINRWNLHGVTSDSVDARFDALKKTRGVLVCYTHGIDDAGGIHMTTTELNYLLSKIDIGISEGWLEGVTYNQLRTKYEQRTDDMLPIIL